MLILPATSAGPSANRSAPPPRKGGGLSGSVLSIAPARIISATRGLSSTRRPVARLPRFEYWAALAGGGVSRAPAVPMAATVLPGGNAT